MSRGSRGAGRFASGRPSRIDAPGSRRRRRFVIAAEFYAGGDRERNVRRTGEGKTHLLRRVAHAERATEWEAEVPKMLLDTTAAAAAVFVISWNMFRGFKDKLYARTSWRYVYNVWSSPAVVRRPQVCVTRIHHRATFIISSERGFRACVRVPRRVRVNFCDQNRRHRSDPFRKTLPPPSPVFESTSTYAHVMYKPARFGSCLTYYAVRVFGACEIMRFVYLPDTVTPNDDNTEFASVLKVDWLDVEYKTRGRYVRLLTAAFAFVRRQSTALEKSRKWLQMLHVFQFDYFFRRFCDVNTNTL